MENRAYAFAVGLFTLLLGAGVVCAALWLSGKTEARASYMLGFLVSLVQGIVATIFVLQLSSRLGTPFPSEQVPGLLMQSFVAGPVSGTLFAAAAAWYRRFLALSGPKRAAAGGRQQSRQQSKRR